MATATPDWVKGLIARFSGPPEEEESLWQVLESLRKLQQRTGAAKVDSKLWLAAVTDTLHAALPTNSSLLREVDDLYKGPPPAGLPSPAAVTGVPSSAEDETEKKALGLIELAQHLMVLNRPVASGLDRQIRDLITQEHMRSWPFRVVIILWLLLCCALFGIDWYYAGKARQVLQDMQQKYDASRALVDKKESELNTMLADASAKISANREAGIKAIEGTSTGAVTQLQGELKIKVEELRKQKLEIAKVPWTGWLLGGGYGIFVLSGLISIFALIVALTHAFSRKKHPTAPK